MERYLQRADLKYVRVVPAFFQSGMRPYEAQGTFKGQQVFLVFHNGGVCVVIGSRVAARVLIHSLFVL